ncbi:MAG: prolipoprotein diacylglyceryl transferase, partial [Eubacteriales bacterium]|nr:prolipoprotein diacylglyceryl transferase [Eubacteriales bacterium]
MNTIEFPGLWGLKFNIDPVAFQTGNVTVYWYGVIIAAAFLLAVLLAMRQSRNFGIKSEYIIDLVLFAAPVAIIFARLYYVAFTFNEFR